MGVFDIGQLNHGLSIAAVVARVSKGVSGGGVKAIAYTSLTALLIGIFLALDLDLTSIGSPSDHHLLRSSGQLDQERARDTTGEALIGSAIYCLDFSNLIDKQSNIDLG